MKSRAISLVLLGLVVGCEQTNQPLPFDLDNAPPTTKAVTPSDSVVISNATGAAVRFPAGAVASATNVTLQGTTAPAAAQKSGTAVSAGYQLDPAGMQLAKPADAELKFSARNNSQAWLASVVNIAGGSVREIGNVRVDIASGMVTTQINRLGTLSVVIPDSRAVFRAQRAGAQKSLSAAPLAVTLDATGTDSVAVNCGDPNNRCSGISVTASDNLLAQVEDAAAVYPLITGKLRINGATATGQVTLSTSIRVLLKSGTTAENVDFQALLEPTASTVVTENASELRFTNMRQVITGSTADQSGTRTIVGTVVIPKTGSGGITLTRTFQLRNAAGQLEEAFVRLTFPVQFHQ